MNVSFKWIDMHVQDYNGIYQKEKINIPYNSPVNEVTVDANGFARFYNSDVIIGYYSVSEIAKTFPKIMSFNECVPEFIAYKFTSEIKKETNWECTCTSLLYGCKCKANKINHDKFYRNVIK